MPTPSLLSRRTLNRTLLQRQHLLRKSTMSALEMVEHLVGLQAQAPNPPYLGLWTRLRGFRHADLARLLTDRSVVRIALMRGTVHLVSARDCLGLRPLVQPPLERGLNGAFGRRLTGVDLSSVAAECHSLLRHGPLTPCDLGELLGKHWPDHDPLALANAARALVPLVQLPPRGVWGQGGQTRYDTAETWLGGPLSPVPLETMVQRYLAAFGPASVQDIQAWSGLTRLREVTDRLPLRVYHADTGAELLDLPDAPLADPDTPAPPRYIAEFDNLVLSHADRTRIIADEHRPALLTSNGIIPGTILVNGFVAGLWRITTHRKHATLTVQPFRRLSKRDTASLESAGARLLAFYAPIAETRTVEI